MFTKTTIFCLAIFLSLRPASLAELPRWETDFDAALERAGKENKNILVVFRGPTESAVCKEVNEKVFDGPEFRTVLGNQFVLFHVLDPKDQDLDREAKAAYDALLKRFHVKLYPITMLLDPMGAVYGQTNVHKPQAKFFVKEIHSLAPRKKLLGEAIALAGKPGATPADAKLLSDKLEELGGNFVIQHHLPLVQKVIALDKDDANGVKTKWEKLKYNVETLREFNQIWVSLSGPLASKKTAAERVAVIDSVIKDRALEGEIRQLLEMRKFAIWNRAKNHAKMLESAELAQGLAPGTRLGKTLPGLIEQLKKTIADSANKDESPPSDAAEADPEPVTEEAAAEEKPAAAAQP